MENVKEALLRCFIWCTLHTVHKYKYHFKGFLMKLQMGASDISYMDLYNRSYRSHIEYRSSPVKYKSSPCSRPPSGHPLMALIVSKRNLKTLKREYCETQPPNSIGWVALSSLFGRRRPASVTPPLISTLWCFRPYKPYIFCEDMILATCQCHSLLSWAQFTVV